jgi:ABC-type sugar transport system, periplasmic component
MEGTIMRTRKLLVAGALTAVSALGLVACAPSGPASDPQSSADGEKITLKVWSWQASTATEWQKVFDVYTETHPNVSIKFEGFQATEYNQLLATGLQGNDGPDVAMIRAYGGAQAAIQAGQLVEIGDKIDGLDSIDPTVLRAAEGREDGKVYGVPFAYQTLQMYYNKTMFDELGLEEPTTWDEFIDLQDALVEEGITPMALGAREDWVLPIFADIMGSARYGGSTFESAVLDGSTTFESDDYVASLQLVADMKKYLDPNVNAIAVADATLQFTSGLAAQWPGGSFDLKTFQDQAPDTEWGVYQVPVAPGSVLDAPVTPGYADGSFGINKASTQQEAALDLLQWMTTTEFGQLVADEIKQFSPLEGVTYSDPLLQEINELYTESSAPYLLLVDFRYGDPTGTAILGPDIQRIFLGEKSAEEAAADLQSGISTWFTPGQ